MSNIYDLNEEETIAMWLYYQAYNYKEIANEQGAQVLDQVDKQFRQQGNRYKLPQTLNYCLITVLHKDLSL